MHVNLVSCSDLLTIRTLLQTVVIMSQTILEPFKADTSKKNNTQREEGVQVE